jgi:hypothetical protein
MRYQAPTPRLSRLLDQLLADEVAAEQDQGDSGDLLGPLAPALADLGTDGQAELSRQEGLQSDGHNDGGDGQVSQADSESDGQLVQADAEPNCDERRPGADARGRVLRR